ncbi:MAG: RloB family protein [Longimicrobiaceae bacterium]
MKDEAKVRARRSGDPNEAFDEIWCVFDVDTHERFEQARRAAQAAGIRVAISNPCFELWLLLHFFAQSAHLSAGDARRRVLRNLPDYDKHLRYEDFAVGYGHAVKRASELERRHAELGREGANPSTGMHRLAERIREFGREARL